MQYRVSAIETMLRDAPDGTVKRSLPQDTDVGEGVESEDHKWLQVGFGKATDQKGFVLAADCKDKSGEPRREVPREAVVQMCVVTELRFNAAEAIQSFRILADFLVARAIIETNITNGGPKIEGSDAVGPLQVSTSEWKNFVNNGGALVRNREESDRQDPIRQIDAAAFRMFSDMKAMSSLRTAADSKDPFLPEYLDVLFAYLTDSPAAALALRDAFATEANRDQPVAKFLTEILKEDGVKKLQKTRGQFFGSQDAPKKLKEVVADAETLLANALKQAFDEIKKAIPEAIPVVSTPELGGTGTTFGEKAPAIMRQLIADFGFTDFQAAGILGNIGRETGGFKFLEEIHPRKGRGGLGWAQWTADRRVAFEAFCQQINKDFKSDEANFGFLKKELEGSKKTVVAHLKAATNLENATGIFEAEFEIAGVVALQDRITWARRALAAFQGVAKAGTAPNSLETAIKGGKIIFDSAALRSELLGLNTGTKVTEKLQQLVLELVGLATPNVIRISSLVRSGTGSHHTEGRAVDIGNEEIAGALLPKVANEAKVAQLSIDELIFDGKLLGQDRNAFNFDQGKKHNFDEATLNAHGNHIHFAVLG